MIIKTKKHLINFDNIADIYTDRLSVTFTLVSSQKIRLELYMAKQAAFKIEKAIIKGNVLVDITEFENDND